MGDHNNGLAFVVQFFKQGQDLVGSFTVQATGWFICQENRRFVDYCPCYGNPLLFSAG